MLSPHPASPQQAPPGFPTGRFTFLERLVALRFISVSLVIHLLLILSGGGVVLFTTAVEQPDFVAGEGELITPGETMSTPAPDAPSLPENPELQSASPVLPAPNMAAITTEAPALFQASAVPVLARLNDLGNGTDGAKGLSQKLTTPVSLAGGGVKGGTARFFGMRSTMENRGIGLAGTFYDPKQTRNRLPTNMSVEAFGSLLSKFVQGGWNEGILDGYYRAPNALFTTQIFVPNMSANEGPRAFEVEKEVQPSRWLAHYRGRISPPSDGDFRFVGAGDDYLVVRLNGRVVLDQGFSKATDWRAEQFYNYGWTSVPNGFARGDKFRALASQYYDIEVLISEKPGGSVFFCLMIEDQNVQYARDGRGNPILPVFRLADGPMPELEKGQTLPPFDLNAPIWRSEPASSN